MGAARFVKKICAQNKYKKKEGKTSVQAEAMSNKHLRFKMGFSFFFTFPKPSDYGHFLERTAQAAHTVQRQPQERIHKYLGDQPKRENAPRATHVRDIAATHPGACIA